MARAELYVFTFCYVLDKHSAFFPQDVWNNPDQVCPKQLFTYNLYFTLLNSPQWLQPFITHPSRNRLYHPTGVYVPYSLRTAVWVLLRRTRIRTVKELWDGANGFSSLSEKTKGFLVAVHFLAIACSLRKRLVNVTGSNIFPNKKRREVKAKKAPNTITQWRKSYFTI